MKFSRMMFFKFTIFFIIFTNFCNLKLSNVELKRKLFKYIKKGNFIQFRKLLSGSNPNRFFKKNKHSLLTFSIINNRINFVKFLVDNGSKININLDSILSPIWQASAHGNFQIVSYLISKGAIVNFLKQYLSPLIIASSKGYVNIVRLLLKHNAEVNVRDMIDLTPLIDACNKGNLQIVKLLVKYGANIHAKGRGMTAIGNARRKKYFKIVKFLKSKK